MPAKPLPPWALVAQDAFKVFMHVRETIAFYMFIIEESIQAVAMATYLLNKNELKADATEYADWALSYLVTPLREFAKGVGTVAYPMNEAYIAFADASEKAFEAQKKIATK